MTDSYGVRNMIQNRKITNINVQTISTEDEIRSLDQKMNILVFSTTNKQFYLIIKTEN